jgi:hypothetical protein
MQGTLDVRCARKPLERKPRRSIGEAARATLAPITGPQQPALLTFVVPAAASSAALPLVSTVGKLNEASLCRRSRRIETVPSGSA